MTRLEDISSLKGERAVKYGATCTLLTILVCAFAGNLSSADKVRVNVRQSDDAIRRQLLELTPPGTAIQKVHEFLQSRLHRDSRIVGGPEEPHPFRGGLDTELGHYLEPQNLFMFPTVVQAFLDFDKDNKLRDIRVRRFVRGW